ncbi:L-fuconate dehydratase [Microbacterium ginsengiterrae]|uniref:L-fuconate dehydratase n=1 Tax=Microbacterium ginsengiterrae TaxID=546115 RepID=A0A7W9C9Q8_9MICO|nr:enolase C-terminal domain-like protein [Microbacterium ginsengiterrae]MBB5741654.1 L-fuconate dehydratase [Microbacterium ginsengiterrae]
MSKIISIETSDVRFPTSLELDGSDAVNVDPDYSAAYVRIVAEDGEAGYALVFTGGRGNEIVVKAIESYGQLIVGEELDDLVGDLGAAATRLVHDSQLRWLGPEKGVSHMAAGAIINALWDVAARREGKPLWRYLADLTPEQVVAAIDFTHISDALTPDEAREILRRGEQGKAERIAELEQNGFRAYTTSPGWLGYSDEKMLRLTREAVADGFELIKLKVGGSLEDDIRRFELVRAEVGPDFPVAIDANQRWDVEDAIAWLAPLKRFEPFWIEEATSTDDVLGHATIRKAIAPMRVATGEAVQSRIIFKQLLQAQAIDVMQIDSVRVAGVNENLANILLAAKFGVPVCPHAGGVGLCELVQHFSFFDYAAVAGTQDDRYIEFVDHLHEHFAEPVVVTGGRYRAPQQPGNGAEMLPDSVATWTFPDGPGWQELERRGLRAATRTAR